MPPPSSLWWSTLDEAVTERTALSADLDVDVVIVGGGYTGLWCARELLRRDPKLQIVVLEKSVCGFGASRRNGGWASALYPQSADTIIDREGLEAYRHLRSELQHAVSSLGASLTNDGIDAHYVRGGSLTVARSSVQEARLRASVQCARERGLDPSSLQWLSPEALRERAVVAQARGATFTPHCARLHPARLVRGLARSVEQLGVRVYENTPVTRLVARRGAHRAYALTAMGSVRANFVVRATEAFTPTLVGERRTVAPLYSLMIATAPLSAAFWDEVGFRHYETFADDRHLIIYGQRTNDNRLAFGGRGAPYHFASTVEQRFDGRAKTFSLLEHTLRELFPSLTSEITHRWGGPLAMPRDHSPSVIVNYNTGLCSAGGYSGDGVVLSYVAGNCLADLIVSPATHTSFTRLPFVQHANKRWEPEPLRWLGINYGLALAAWSDRVEDRHHRESRGTALLERLTS
ncbi:MAG: NAD(P)/FAD-dependent oxidoreductase [Acidimicrobiales bacterium]